MKASKRPFIMDRGIVYLIPQVSKNYSHTYVMTYLRPQVLKVFVSFLNSIVNQTISYKLEYGAVLYISHFI